MPRRPRESAPCQTGAVSHKSEFEKCPRFGSFNHAGGKAWSCSATFGAPGRHSNVNHSSTTRAKNIENQTTHNRPTSCYRASTWSENFKNLPNSESCSSPKGERIWTVSSFPKHNIYLQIHHSTPFYQFANKGDYWHSFSSFVISPSGRWSSNASIIRFSSFLSMEANRNEICGQPKAALKFKCVDHTFVFFSLNVSREGNNL